MRDCELAHTFCFWKLLRTFTGKMTRGLSLRMIFSLLFQDTLFFPPSVFLFCCVSHPLPLPLLSSLLGCIPPLIGLPFLRSLLIRVLCGCLLFVSYVCASVCISVSCQLIFILFFCSSVSIPAWRRCPLLAAFLSFVYFCFPLFSPNVFPV